MTHDRFQRYVIEARDDQGRLRFDCEQPPVRAFTDIEIARLVWARVPDLKVPLDGRDICNWTRHVHEAWVARPKTW